MTEQAIHIRYNQAGYLPHAQKHIIAFANFDLSGSVFKVIQSNQTVFEGKLSTSICSQGPHTSHQFYHLIDLSFLKELGQYQLRVENQTIDFKIDSNPYQELIQQALIHLKGCRSGSAEAGTHQLSHLGDKQAPVHIIDGEPKNGKWKPESPERHLDVQGGWYDAGDYIKFTLTIAHTVYYLLEAYQSNSKIFSQGVQDSEISITPLLSEAKFGLDYLLKTFPDPNTFVIQVGNFEDHLQGKRLPEHDTLDGKRPALCALSPTHMGITAAALAKGAQVFYAFDKESSEIYADTAKRIFARAQQEDVLKESAFEIKDTNELYKDDSIEDNMALAALELYKLLKEEVYLNQAKAYKVQGVHWMGWGNYQTTVNFNLAKYNDEFALTELDKDITFFIEQSKKNVWGIPTRYAWTSLLPWLSIGAMAKEYALNFENKNTEKALMLHEKVRDLFLGVNNWGVAFIASPQLSNPIRNLYSQVYTLQKKYPLGAVSEGPGDRKTHDALSHLLPDADRSPLAKFNTEEAVFIDHPDDFMIQENVTMLQSAAIWILALSGDQ